MVVGYAVDQGGGVPAAPRPDWTQAVLVPAWDYVQVQMIMRAVGSGAG